MVPGEHSRWRRPEPRTVADRTGSQVGKSDQSVWIVAFFKEILQNSGFDVKTVAITMDRVQKSIAISGLIAAALGITAYVSIDSQPEESSDFLGISFEKDFLKDVPICIDDNLTPELCRVSTADPQKFEVRGLPYLPITPGYRVFVTLENNKPINLVLSGKTSDFRMIHSMSERYFGEPTEIIDNWSWKNTSGSFNNISYHWKSESTGIVLLRNEEDLSTYSINISKIGNLESPEEAISSSDT